MSRFEDSISSIGGKSRQARIFETSDFYNGNHRTCNVTMAQPVVNSSEYVVKHGDPLGEYQVFGDSFRGSPTKASPNKLNRHVSQIFNSSSHRNFDTFAPNS